MLAGDSDDSKQPFLSFMQDGQLGRGYCYRNFFVRLLLWLFWFSLEEAMLCLHEDLVDIMTSWTRLLMELLDK